MDTSKAYIKMCDCEEIQGLCDKYAIDGNDYWVTLSERLMLPEHGYCTTWLPRQDQLQEMVRGSYPRQYLMVVAFAKFCVDVVETDSLSMEQLWLAFVMKGKYNRTWNGEEWKNV